MMKLPFKKNALQLVLAGCLLGAAAVPVSAHHPIQAKFDPATAASLSGIVSYVDWSNPHVHVFVNVTTAQGLVENWAVELESPITLKASGWSAESLKPGDRIEVQGLAVRNGTRQIWGESVKLARSGATVYSVSDDLAPQPGGGATPRWPDGQVALGAISGSTDGYWGFPTSTVLVEDGANVAMDRYGQLRNINDAAKVAPLQDWALALYRHRQQRDLRDDPLWINCKPPGGPRQYQDDFGIKLVEDRAGKRVFVLMGSGNHNFRIIYLDGRSQEGSVSGDDDNPLYYGRSVGHWEGDTLVVNTTGFNEDFWFSNGGLPHTSLLTLHERFSRPNLDTLHYEVTVEDPGAYTRNWTASWDMKWVAGAELPVHFCQDNRP
jgi:hypothetical protein